MCVYIYIYIYIYICIAGGGSELPHAGHAWSCSFTCLIIVVVLNNCMMLSRFLITKTLGLELPSKGWKCAIVCSTVSYNIVYYTIL